MSPDEEVKWKLNVASTLAEIHTDQKNLSANIDTHIDAVNKSVDKLSSIVIGNGKIGLVGEVSNIKSKYAAFYGLGILLLSALLNYAVEVKVFGTHASH